MTTAPSGELGWTRALRSIAERIIRSAGDDLPADRALRETLKSARGLSRDDSAQISRSVFAFFRWLGWLDTGAPCTDQIDQARRLAERFASDPGGFTDAELLQRAVPSWTKDEMPVSLDWVRLLQGEPVLWLRARHGQGKVVAQRLPEARVFGEGALADTVQYRGSQDLFQTPEFHSGEFEVQDLSSQAVGLLCAPSPGQTWWDACAGEGGKLLHLSALMENRGLIWATDRAAWRLQKLRRRTARARVFNYRSALWDGGARLPTKTRFDGVLLDAPCSGIGTWQRNPHARWTNTPDQVKELGQLQSQLLFNAASAVKPGGKLVFAVCSLSRTETTDVVTSFQRDRPEFEPVPVANPLKSGDAPKPGLCLWPQQFGGNGMFVAVWKRS